MAAGTVPLTAVTFTPVYRGYVLAVLFLGYVVNVMDRGVLAVLIESIKGEFALSDTQLGILSGITFAFFYSTLGVPIAMWADRTVRRNVLATCCMLWSGMTALCGLATGFWSLAGARAGTAVGEAGGSPPSHALISDYFPREQRGTALSLYALGVPVGAMLGQFLGGWGNQFYGWRTTFILIGLPGLLVAALVRFTIVEPPRGHADGASAAVASAPAPPLWSVVRFLWRYVSFRHMCLAAALHSVVWYSGSALNGAFFARSHSMQSGEYGTWLALFSIVGAIGTLLGGFLADRISTWRGDRRWYMWVPGVATLIMVPFQFMSYLARDLWVVVPSFCVMFILASMFFGPSFAVTQGLATLRTRAVATSILLFVQTFIGLGLGPFLAGIPSVVYGLWGLVV
ncbi:MAG: MFS transporter, partial [Gemmatimonadetes bacterium]|nr:MFS transporter [Gemmatimonadota bacterium]